MRQLLRHAADLGAGVFVARLEPGVLGQYHVNEHEIFLDNRLTPVERRSILAHELGHAAYRHPCDDDPVAERAANIYAARLLIDPVEYARLERIDPDQHHLAEDLHVTADVIFTYEEHCLERLHGMTYAHPRMGAWQWAYRGEVAS